LGRLEVLLCHPGGPFWAKRDQGAWSIPKGEFEDGEEPLSAAKREFTEETGFTATCGEILLLEPVRQPGGKLVYAWAVRCDLDPSSLKSNTFSLEWPPKSGRYQQFPEVDRAAWLGIEEASHKMLKGQLPFLVELQRKLRAFR